MIDYYNPALAGAATQQNPYRFHDTQTFLELVKTETPNILPEAIVYLDLDDAVSAFYAGCLLASCVMLGVAAEAEFLRLAEVAAAHPAYGGKFSAVAQKSMVRQKIVKSQDCLKPCFPRCHKTPRKI